MSWKATRRGHNELRWVKEKTDSDGSLSWCVVNRYLAVEHGERREVRRKINQEMYTDYLKKADQTRQTIHKKFIYFVIDNQPYTIESFDHEGKMRHLLKLGTDVAEDVGGLKVPDWINLGKDVTEDPKFFNHNIALKK